MHLLLAALQGKVSSPKRVNCLPGGEALTLKKSLVHSVQVRVWKGHRFIMWSRTSYTVGVGQLLPVKTMCPLTNVAAGVLG
jgi:hypothetical protein